MAKTREVTMSNGVVIEGVPDNVSDEEVRAKYRKNYGTKEMQDLSQKAKDIGYPVEAARDIGFKEEDIADFISKHPKYKQEQEEIAKLGGEEAIKKAPVEMFGRGILQAGKEALHGIKQLYTEPAGAMSKDIRDNEREAVANLDAQTYAVLKSAAGQFGYDVTKIATAFGPAAIAKLGGMPRVAAALSGMSKGLEPDVLYGGAMAQGAISGALEPTRPGGTPGANIATGMAMGGGTQLGMNLLGKAMPRVGLKPPTGLNALLPNQPAAWTTEERQELAKVARDKGYELPAAAQTGSKALESLQAAAESLPFGGWNTARMMRKNKAALNTTVNESIGMGGDFVSPQTLGDAEDIIGGKLDKVAKELPRTKLGLQWAHDIKAAYDKYAELEHPDPEALKALRHWMDAASLKQSKVLVSPGGQKLGAFVPTELLMKNRSDLARKARAASSGDNANWQLADAYNGIVTAIDDAIEANLPKNSKGLYAEGRKQWRNLLIATKAYDGATDGTNPMKLVAALRQTYGPEVSRIPTGENALIDASRIHSMFKLKVPDSGTPGRLERAGLLKRIGAQEAVGAAAGYGAFGGPSGAVTGMIGATALPPIVGGIGTSSTLGRALTDPEFRSSVQAIAQGSARAAGLGLGLPPTLRLMFSDVNQ